MTRVTVYINRTDKDGTVICDMISQPAVMESTTPDGLDVSIVLDGDKLARMLTPSIIQDITRSTRLVAS